LSAQILAIRLGIDRPKTGLEKVESGFVARAIDFARFGQLYLDDGMAGGWQIGPAAWVAQSRAAPIENAPNRFIDADGHYRNLWWGRRVGRAKPSALEVVVLI
jgi:CubicO group peptidase (beta-lactamase class C family)